jgi:hypothetical protein
MAETKGYYLMEVNFDRKKLCFICAVKSAAGADPEEIDISFQTDDYDYINCEVCGKFIDDKVTI